MTILGPDGQPFNETSKDGQHGGGRKWRIIGGFIAALATISTVCLNLDGLTRSPVFATANVKFVKMETDASRFYVTLRNVGSETALLTEGRVIFDKFLETDAPLRVQLSAINSSWTAELELSPEKSTYKLSQLNLELKPDETVVFTVKLLPKEGSSFACVRGRVELISDDDELLESPSVVVLMGNYSIAYANGWRMRNGAKEQFLIGRDEALDFADSILALSPSQGSHAAEFANTIKQ